MGAISQSILGARWSGLNDAIARSFQMNVHLSLFLLAPGVAEKNGKKRRPPLAVFLVKKCPIFKAHFHSQLGQFLHYDRVIDTKM